MKSQPLRLLTLSALLLFTLLATAANEDRRQFRPCRAATPPQHFAARSANGRRATAEGHYKGERHQLVVLTAFSDLTFSESQPITVWNKILNTERLDEEPFYGSVHDYFYDQSYSQMDLRFDLHYVCTTEPHTTYRSTATDDRGCTILVQDVVAALSNEVTDWSPYDWDGDGYVDQLVIVFAGKGQNDGGGSNSIWANQCWMTAYGEEPVKVSDGKDGTLLLDTYCCVPELDGRNTYGSFGTFCHEYSHCIGLPDFYYGYNNFLYKWDIMDSGNYNLNGYCPPCYSTHERICMGWLDAVELNEAATISGMQPADSHQECYLVRNDEQPDEFYIVENRRQQGWDRSLPGSGVLIFHVRYDEGIWRKGVPNNLSEQRYTIVKANNSSKYKDWAYPYLGNDSLTANSLPASIIPTKSITNIRVADNGTASFDFMGGLPTEAKGDLNGDGIVNALDIQLEINAAVEGYADAKYDMNGDGIVNALDIQEVINLAVHFNESEL